MEESGFSPMQKKSVPKYEVVGQSFSKEPEVGGKCYPVFVGGMDLAPGLTQNSMAARCCNKLRCSACDKTVLRLA